MRQIRFIVVHHPASDNITLTLRDHIHPPFTDSPYDFWIENPTGEIVKGRVLTKQGAHVIPDYPEWRDVNNRTAIGVAFEGNFEDDRPPIRPSDEQIERGAVLLAQLCLEYGIWPNDHTRTPAQILQDGAILPHKFVSRTACPGRHFMAQWDVLIGKTRWYFNQLRGEV